MIIEMEGKKKCELLKEIRKNIATKNGIDYEPDNCEYKESCPGTCPKCDAEAEQLLAELKKKEQIDTSGNIELLEKNDSQESNESLESHYGETDISSEDQQNKTYLIFDPEKGKFIISTSQRNTDDLWKDLSLPGAFE